MKIRSLIISIAVALVPFVSAAQVGNPISVSGNHVGLNAPDATVSSVNLNAPNAGGTASIFTGGSERLKLDGGGSVYLPVSNPADGTAATTVATGGTIDTTKFWQRVTDAGAITGVILEAGTAHGQLVIVTVDKDASGSVTMAAESTSNVCSGTGAVVAAGESALFVWDATDTCWSENGL